MRLNIVFLTLLFLVVNYGFAGTCSSITRTDFVDGNILSASDLNSQFGASYTAINAADGGCITDGTLEAAALNTTDFSAQLNGIKRGCEVSNTATSSFQIGQCYATVNGNSIKTIATTSVTYANLDTGSMATSTSYYIYIEDGSTGSTLTPKISATAPNGRGYNTSNDLVLARFRTGTSSTDFRKGSVYQWDSSGYKSANRVNEVFYIDDTGDLYTSFGIGTRGGLVTSATRTATGIYTITTDSNYSDDFDCIASATNNPSGLDTVSDKFAYSGGTIFAVYDLSDAALKDSFIKLHCIVNLKD